MEDEIEEDFEENLETNSCQSSMAPNLWNTYFPGEAFNPTDERLVMIQCFRDLFQQQKSAPIFANFGKVQTESLPLNFPELKKALTKELIQTIEDKPEFSIPCIAYALNDIILDSEKENISTFSFSDLISAPKKKRVIPRFYNFEPITPLRHLKSNLIGKFVSVRGTVIRVGNVKPLIKSMNFSCFKCGTSFTIYFKDGKYKSPTKCPASNCRCKNFEPNRSSCLTVDWQKIRLQELLDKKDPGRIPRTVECELTGDLVDSCVPGDVITLSGVVKVMSTDAGKGYSTKDKSIFLIYLDANSVDNTKLDNGKLEWLQWDKEELQRLREVAEEENVFKLIVNSICPGIYGHETVKAGLALALFGGVQKFTDQKNKVPIRGDPHVLIVGDPGLGKSQMLLSVSNIAPRSVYVCGSYSSSCGLTVSVLKEPGSNDYTLEAGALVLADQGCCCIDEFDKMVDEHQSLLEAMEQQSVNIAKAGIVCSLPARTSVISAANPVGGHYNRGKTVSENLKMSPALLSRFDLIFILLDKPDEQKDQLLSEHLMALHGGEQPKTFTGSQFSQSSQHAEQSLLEKLRIHPSEHFEPIHPVLLRKYIGYARKYVHPKLTAEACKLIQTFYLNLREKHKGSDATPITTRQLESLIRLAEARAKLEMREDVTEQDAKDVIDLMKEALFDSFEDEYGNIDFRRNTGMSKSKESSRFISSLHKIAEKKMDFMFTLQELYQHAVDIGINTKSFEDFIDTLNTQGYLLKKGPRTFKLTTTSVSR